ncbi:prolyl oligopeptidase family serine peptidase [Sphingomonas sp. BIUV-7]|uniref:Prolyl oligopeptidase family serine peptidase n=1 Tax=Sphingomonas natans TaxID=3063330 RepID=A0ABT8YED5_9SPHN|nr:prolyl oligopeptidase family serine peptidase [Sphingomonas sp. BIUV-7]MDO6416024.1 prolyl oligopeptidase family serine peptidase [Sphingomonas sp. BIUV-7]
MARLIYGLLFGMLAAGAGATQERTIAPPAAITGDGVPAIPAALAAKTRPYLEYRAAIFEGWNPATKAALIATNFGNTRQLHEVALPMGDRRQISFETDTIAAGDYAPGKGDALLVQKDVGGSEFWQLYTLANGRLTLLTDGKSRNQIGAWSRDGHWLAYSSTRRNGTDSDLYIVDPRDPKSDRMLAQLSGGGWSVTGFTPDGTSAIVRRYVSIAKSDLFLMDIANGAMRPIGDHKKAISYADARFAKDGVLWATSDEGSAFQRLGTIDPSSGIFTPVPGQTKWDVELFSLSAEGDFVAFVINEAGVSRLKVLDTRTGAIRPVADLPVGVISALKVAPWGEIGLSLASARAASDIYSVEPKTLKVTRWTQSETGGLDPAANVEPELVTVKSFDGETVSGFLYRPDPKKFPGKRPLIVDIHGGPESQTRPGFLGRANYYPNELGVALFYPNVRGSSGYGKRFVGLDDGPFKREDSVKDIGAFLDRLVADPQIDAARIGETGGSYGGYMCYASAIRYGPRFKGAICLRAVSGFVSLLEHTQSYRRDLRRVEYGDERDPKQRAKLLAISPVTHVAEIKIPLVIITGGNDPRVPPSESEQMVKAVRANNVPVWHVLAADEGHGYVKKDNLDYQFWASLLFWQKNLLGPGGK